MSTTSKHISPAQPPPVALSADVMGTFRPARVFKDAVINEGSSAAADGPRDPSSPPVLHITSVAFDDSGERCVTAGEDDVFTVYDTRRGKKLKTLYSKKYGIAHARFTHRQQNIIHASTKGDNALRYHSMHDNKYLAYFQGHTGTVRSLQMNPADDTFLSAGDDGTVRLWDLRTQACRGLVNDIGGSTVAAFDNTGVVFAVASSQLQTVMLFDSASLDDAPFAHIPFLDVELAKISSPPPRPTFTSLSFSNNGKFLLVGTAGDIHYVLDAFDLNIVRRLEGHGGLGRNSGEEVCWSADSAWVLSGSADGSIVGWSLAASFESQPEVTPMRPVPTLQPTVAMRPGEGLHAASRAVAMNPRLSLLGVGGEQLSFWLPAPAADVEEGW